MRAAIVAKRSPPRLDCIGAQQVKTIEATDSRSCHQVVGQSWRERGIEILSCFTMAKGSRPWALLLGVVTVEPPTRVSGRVGNCSSK
jgi:hypothetical protein